jgi:sugar lactone lactonase YvrE
VLAARYANALDISSDGRVAYFTDSQAVPVLLNDGRAPGSTPPGGGAPLGPRSPPRPRPWFDTFASFLLGLYSGERTGRLLAYDFHSGRTSVLATGLFYANGVAMAGDGSFLVVAETSTFHLHRYWLGNSSSSRGAADRSGGAGGARDGRGRLERFTAEQLPGFPDGVSRSRAWPGSFWVALPAPHTPLLDGALRFRALRVVMAHLPPHLRPRIKSWGAVARVGGCVVSPTLIHARYYTR